MILYGDFYYQGSESRAGVKDPSKIYYEVSLLDDNDQVKCSVSPELFNTVLPGIKRFAPCKCKFNLNPTYSTLKLLEITPEK